MSDSSPSILRRNTPRLVAALVIFGLFLASRPTLPSATERERIAARFRFGNDVLPEIPGGKPSDSLRNRRSVHPSLEHISGWISSVGAAVSLNDLDGDGLPNDVAYVDTRIDRVVIACVPGTTQRYEPFALEPAPLPYRRATMAPMGCLPGDFNEDGLMDILVYYWGRTPIAFLHKRASGKVEGRRLSGDTFLRRELVAGSERWFTNVATLADLDGDGHVDILVANYFPDGARILDANATGDSPMQRSMSRALNSGRKHLLLWESADQGNDEQSPPEVRFREIEGVFDEPILYGWTLAVGAGDLDGDLLPELYLANDFGPDRLLHNRSSPGSPRFALLEGRRTMTTPSSKVLGRDSFKGMGIDFGDLNGDGLLDIYVSNIAAKFALLESHFAFISTGETDLMRAGVAPYVDRSEEIGLSRSGWGWEAKLGDFDNDGTLEALQAVGFVKGTVNRWPELQELAMGNDEMLSDPTNWPRFSPNDDLSGHLQNPFFVREGPSGRFHDHALSLNLSQPGVSRGIATADVDGDGRLDLAVANQWAPSSFHHNTAPEVGSFLGLHLRLPMKPGATRVRAGHPGPDTQGRPAIGASAMVLLPNGSRLVGQVDGGNGHSGKRSPDIHLGLGQMAPDTRVNIMLRWREPGGRVRSEELTMSPGWHTVLLGWDGNSPENIKGASAQ